MTLFTVKDNQDNIIVDSLEVRSVELTNNDDSIECEVGIPVIVSFPFSLITSLLGKTSKLFIDGDKIAEGETISVYKINSGSIDLFKFTLKK